MTLGLFCLAVLALVVIACAAVAAVLLMAERRQLDVYATRLAAEQQVEMATRGTLQAMREAVRHAGRD